MILTTNYVILSCISRILIIMISTFAITNELIKALPCFFLLAFCCLLLTAYFLLLASYFLLLASYFLHLTFNQLIKYSSLIEIECSLKVLSWQHFEDHCASRQLRCRCPLYGTGAAVQRILTF